MDKPQSKTGRSHEENQERAYIAASRRSDRSLEARVQSARMASDIHRKRTGKGFKITEEIVQKEEMYEEEDDDVSRRVGLLGMLPPHMRTSSELLNTRVEHYTKHKYALAEAAGRASHKMWLESNRIHDDFDKAFRRLSHPGPQPQHFAPRLSDPGPLFSLFDQTQPGMPSQTPRGDDTGVGFSTVAYAQPGPGPGQHFVPEQARPLMYDDRLSPPALTPGSSTDTPPQNSTPACPVTEIAEPTQHAATMPPDSSFTADVPPEVKMLTQFGMATVPQLDLVCGVPGPAGPGFMEYLPVDHQQDMAGMDKFQHDMMGQSMPSASGMLPLVPDTMDLGACPTETTPGAVDLNIEDYLNLDSNITLR